MFAHGDQEPTAASKCARSAATVVLLVSVAAASVATARPAARQPTSEDRALAESLFREGRTLTEQGDHEQACPKYAESQRLDPALGTLLNLAECHAQVGRTASAWAAFKEVRETAQRVGQLDRVTYAAERVAALEQELSYVQLELPADADLQRVAIDGRTLGRAAYSTRLPLDPGNHELTVTTGRGTTTSVFVLPLGPAEQRVRLGLDGGPPTPATDGPDRTDDPDPRSIAGWVALGMGVVGLGAGTYFGLRAMALKSDSDELCDDTGCDPEGLDLFEDARQHANLATIGFAVGGAAVTVGGGLLIWAAADPLGGGNVGVAGLF